MGEDVGCALMTPPPKYLKVDLRAFRGLEQLKLQCHTRITVVLESPPLYASPSAQGFVPPISKLELETLHPNRFLPLIELLAPTLEKLIIAWWGLEKETSLWHHAEAGVQHWNKGEIWLGKPKAKLTALKTIKLYYEQLDNSHLRLMRPPLEASKKKLFARDVRVIKLDSMGEFFGMCPRLRILEFFVDELLLFDVDTMFQNLPPLVRVFRWHGVLFTSLFENLKRWVGNAQRSGKLHTLAISHNAPNRRPEFVANSEAYVCRELAAVCEHRLIKYLARFDLCGDRLPARITDGDEYINLRGELVTRPPSKDRNEDEEFRPLTLWN